MPRRINVLTRGAALVGSLFIGNTSPFGILKGSGAPTDGTSGTGAGEANTGSKYVDVATGDHYINIGTKTSPTWLLGSGPTAARFLTVALTNAEILALRATPKTIAAAPGAGYRWQLIEGTLNLNLTGAYTESADNLAVRYKDGSGVTVSQAIETTGLLDQTGKIHSNILAKLDAIATAAQAENQPLVLHNTGDGEFGGGNAANTGRVTLAVRRVATL